MTYAERLEQTVGYLNHLGYLHCTACATGDGQRPPHEGWEPMRPHYLAPDDRCDGCHRRVIPDGILPPPLRP